MHEFKEKTTAAFKFETDASSAFEGDYIPVTTFLEFRQRFWEEDDDAKKHWIKEREKRDAAAADAVEVDVDDEPTDDVLGIH